MFSAKLSVPVAYKAYNCQYPNAAPLYILASIPLPRPDIAPFCDYDQWVSALQHRLLALNPHTIFFETSLRHLSTTEAWRDGLDLKSTAHAAFQVGLALGSKFESLEKEGPHQAFSALSPIKFLGFSLANRLYYSFLFHHPFLTELALSCLSFSLAASFTALSYALWSRIFKDSSHLRLISGACAAAIGSVCIALNRQRDRAELAAIQLPLQALSRSYIHTFSLPSLKGTSWAAYWDPPTLTFLRTRHWAITLIDRFLSHPLTALARTESALTQCDPIPPALLRAAQSLHPLIHKHPVTRLDRAEALTYAKSKRPIEDSSHRALGAPCLVPEFERRGREPIARLIVVQALHFEALAQAFRDRGCALEPLSLETDPVLRHRS